ncbi:MAG: rod shape-determining protein MreC [Muribaculaceae bacterium]|nr:rod shape-determining protein MreC [Muribaculaceae bacterium]
MRNLFLFLLRYRAWIVFIIYVVISCTLLFNNNPYQRHVYMTSASRVSATVYDAAHSVTGYFHLRSINDDLQRRNAQLESEVIALRLKVDALELEASADSLEVVEPLKMYDFILAPVINNSITHPYNYITIAKGEADGVKPEMGVVDQNGVVGVVNVTGNRYSRIISLLNPDFRLSCKLKGSDVFGSLVWDGKSPREALLEELPKHTVFEPGDTIITSGYSAVFPEGIPVGIVKGNEHNADDNFFTLRVELLTDFSKLSTVRLVVSNDRDEIKKIESTSTK